jgi:hypothetical protein
MSDKSYPNLAVKKSTAALTFAIKISYLDFSQAPFHFQ